MKAKFTLFVTALLFSMVAQSQTVKWCIHPEYDEITYFSEDLFKCVEWSGKIQLINWDGKAILHNVEADAVTDFEEGYAIVLKGNKILGFLEETREHKFQSVNGEYLITQYPFFSEGLLAVADGKGKMGYMDVHANLVIPCKYEQARPFKQGWASVEMAKKSVYYINQQGKTRNPEGFHGGKLTKGSNFNENGEAVVANYQDYAVIGTNMQVKRKIDYTSELPVRSCDYAYSANAKDCSEGKMSINNHDANHNFETFTKNGLYGYRTILEPEDIEIPAQFDKAQNFFDDRAIVKKGGKVGVLELLEGEFVPHWPAESVRVYPDGNTNRLTFALETPNSFSSDEIKLDFDDGSGNFNKNVSRNYTFQPRFIDNAEKCRLKGRVTYDGLLLWEGSQDVKINHITIDIKSPSVTTEFADENDNQTVKTTITNTSDVDVVLEATFKVDGQLVPFKGTLKSKQSKTLTKSVKVTETKNVSATVSVKVDGHDCGSKSSTVSLKI